MIDTNYINISTTNTKSQTFRLPAAIIHKSPANRSVNDRWLGVQICVKISLVKDMKSIMVIKRENITKLALLVQCAYLLYAKHKHTHTR